MPNNQSFWKKIFNSRFFLLIIIFLAIFIIFAYARVVYKDYLVKQEIEKLSQEVERLKGKQIETLELVDYVKSKEFALQKARTELNMVKKGEGIAVINSFEQTSDIGSGQDNDEVLELNNNNFYNWWKFFFKK